MCVCVCSPGDTVCIYKIFASSFLQLLLHGRKLYIHSAVTAARAAAAVCLVGCQYHSLSVNMTTGGLQVFIYQTVALTKSTRVSG